MVAPEPSVAVARMLNVSCNTLLRLLSLRPNQTAKWPANVGIVGSSGTNTNQPSCVDVSQTSPAVFTVMCMTALNVAVTVPAGAPHCAPTGNVWVTLWRFVVSVNAPLPPARALGAANASRPTRPRDTTARRNAGSLAIPNSSRRDGPGSPLARRSRGGQVGTGVSTVLSLARYAPLEAVRQGG